MTLLRGKRLSKMDPEAESFTSSVATDDPLLKPTIMINKAHVISLYLDGIISRDDASNILKSLSSIPDDFVLDPKLEDVHMNVESYVISKAGKSGGYLNLGKSRNDQVACALRILVREACIEIVTNSLKTAKSLLTTSEEFLEVVMPGFTHLQVAQPTTLAHYLTCYAEAIIRDSERFVDLYDRTNLSTMGASAFAGSTVPLNRKRVAELLGFEGLVHNTIDAVGSRDFLLEFLSAAMIMQLDLSRMAEDMIFYTSNEAGYISIPDGYASTSSVMPQKKNAVVFEMIRAKASSVIGFVTSAAANLKGLPQSYNLDMQELNRYILEASDIVKTSLRLTGSILSQVAIYPERMNYGASSGWSIATDMAEMLTMKERIPFRDSHYIVGAAVSAIGSDSNYAKFKKTIISEAEKKGYTLSKDSLPENYDALASINSKRSSGSPNPAHVRVIIDDLVLEIAKLEQWVEAKSKALNLSSKRLNDELNKIIEEVRNVGF